MAKGIKINTIIITENIDQLVLDKWENCTCINIGLATVEINGIPYDTKDSVVFGINSNGYLDDTLKIEFPNNTRKLSQKLVIQYEIIPGAYENYC